MPKPTIDEFLSFLEERLAAHEGGAGSLHISYDDATFSYIISQTKMDKFRTNETLGCSRFLSRAIELAISGKKYED